MKVLVLTLSLVQLVLTACGAAPTVSEARSKKVDPKLDAPASGKPDSSNSNGASASNSQSTNKPPPSSGGSSSVSSAMTLDEAKAKCASCHQPGGSGANTWNKAGGSEADWAAFANASRSAVIADRMPPPNGLSGADKTRMIAFLDKLVGGSSGGAAQPLKYNFDTAKALCIGCHAKGKSSPRLETENQWRNNKSEIRSEVKSGAMPRKKTLTAEEKKALLSFINSL